MIDTVKMDRESDPRADAATALGRNASRRPLLSIGICTYNRADRYLNEALGSAVEQTYPNLEIIVSDNCSTDDTPSVVRSFADPRIRYYRQARNLGVTENFNFCLDRARGVYFLLLHDDDRIDSDLLSACMAAASDQPDYGVIRTGARTIDADGRVIAERRNEAGGLSTPDFFVAWFEGRTQQYYCNTLYNTRLLKESGGFQSPANLFQDAVATVRLAAGYGRIDITEAKASFRRHGGNNGSRERVRDWCDDSLYLLDIMCDLVPDDRERERVREAGMIFFCRKNYRQASRIRSRVKRLNTYWTVYHRFGFVYSPWKFRGRKPFGRPLSRATA